MSDPLVNTEAEAILLGALMQERSLIDRAADMLTPADFHIPIHGRLFEAIVREASLGKTPTPVSLKGYFENDEELGHMGGVGYLARLSGTMGGLLAPFETATHIADIAERRRMRAGLATASDACADLTVEMGEISGHAEAALMGKIKTGALEVNAGEAADLLFEKMKDRRAGLRCGKIPEVDAVLGPVKRKNLVLIGARPGMGKTAFASSYSLGVAQSGHGVLFISLEMGADELAGRMICDLSFDSDERIPADAIVENRLTDRQMHRAIEARDYLTSLPFMIYDGNLSANRIGAVIRRHARKMAARGQKLELVVVDYVQLLQADSAKQSAYEKTSAISLALKGAAKDNDIAIMALVQLNRDVEKRPDKRPMPSDLRDSGQLEQDADAIMFLLRPEEYLRREEPDPGTEDHLEWQSMMDKAAGQIEFIVEKRRHGRKGIGHGAFHADFQAVR